MVNHLHSTFLDNSKEYKDCEQFWERLCSEVIKEKSPVTDWKPWLTTTFADGTPFGDGNPICNLMSPSTHKGVRIIQHPASSDELVLSGFTETFGHAPEEDQYVIELVVVCELSIESAEWARRLIAEWVKTKDVDKDFDSVIASLSPQ